MWSDSCFELVAQSVGWLKKPERVIIQSKLGLGRSFMRRTGNPTSMLRIMGNVTKHEGPDAHHERGEGVSDATVKALGKVSEALEVVEHARGLLYGFHRLTGKADLALGDAVRMLHDAGHHELAKNLEQRIVGRNVISGRWTFQIVEDYDDGYYSEFKEAEKHAREVLVGGKRHLFEAEMKEERRTHGRAHHEAVPAEATDLNDTEVFD